MHDGNLASGATEVDESQAEPVAEGVGEGRFRRYYHVHPPPCFLIVTYRAPRQPATAPADIGARADAHCRRPPRGDRVADRRPAAALRRWRRRPASANLPSRTQFA